jgi:hypothetical protein
MVTRVEPWRYGLTLLPGAVSVDDPPNDARKDEVMRARSERGWELVIAVTERDGSDLLVFRRPATDAVSGS